MEFVISYSLKSAATLGNEDNRCNKILALTFYLELFFMIFADKSLPLWAQTIKPIWNLWG